MSRHYVAKLEKLKKEKRMLVHIGEKPILLLADNEEVFALDDRCPHLKASLFKGEYADGVIRCKKHGARFNLRTGEVVERAKIGPLPMPTKHAQPIETVIEDGKVYVKL